MNNTSILNNQMHIQQKCSFFQSNQLFLRFSNVVLYPLTCESPPRWVLAYWQVSLKSLQRFLRQKSKQEPQGVTNQKVYSFHHKQLIYVCKWLGNKSNTNVAKYAGEVILRVNKVKQRLACEIDLWPLTLKTNRVLPLVISSMCTKLDGPSWNG